ncbi:MAG: prolipoprotein diacylglyceryl transferase [Rhodospirillales bacterium]|nr:prolipoprotein diacylglyceryl transferase [Rhodospirillales bacterium]
MLPVLPYPIIDPVAVDFGTIEIGSFVLPIAIRWYALAYIVSILLGWRIVRRLAKAPPRAVPPHAFDDFIVWATVGIILGGRIGFVLFALIFYEGGPYRADPLAMLAIWQGGMAFHGGLIGVIIAALLFCRHGKLPFLAFTDLLACVTPVGLLFGRLANFINGELYGRATDVPWAMVFPHGGPEPRHPSQLYEAGLEGAALLVILLLLWRSEAVRRRFGVLSGTFLIGYGVFRAFVEMFRDADPGVGFLLAGTTTGQWFSVPMVLFGLYLIIRARAQPAPPEDAAPAKERRQGAQ